MPKKKELEAGAASIIIQLTEHAITVYHGDHSNMELLHTINVKNGTWKKLWKVLEECGDIQFRALD